MVQGVEGGNNSLEDVSGGVQVAELLTQEHLGSQGCRVLEALVDVGHDAAQDLHATVGVEPRSVSRDGAPGEEDHAPFGQALFGAEHDIEQRHRVEPVTAGIRSGHPGGLRGLQTMPDSIQTDCF